MKTVDDYIFSIRSQGGYSFTIDDVRKYTTVSASALSLALHRAVKKNKIASVRKGFYIIIPPEYAAKGMLPVTYFIDDLMKWLNRSYYMGMYSAAAILGAAHQQPMEAYICIHKPALRSIRNSKLIINFMVKSDWDSRDIRDIKTDMGYIPVSSPELTAFDLLYYQHKGGVHRAFPIIEEIVEGMLDDSLKVGSLEVGSRESTKGESLKRAAERYPFTSAVQRLGYICDRILQLQEIAGPLEGFIEQKKPDYTRLSTKHPKQGNYDPKWKIIENINLEINLEAEI